MVRLRFRAYVLAFLMRRIGYRRTVKWGLDRGWIAEAGDDYRVRLKQP